jgi:hypothetical protein
VVVVVAAAAAAVAAAAIDCGSSPTDGPGHVAKRFVTTDLLLFFVTYFYHMFSVKFRNQLPKRRCFSFM